MISAVVIMVAEGAAATMAEEVAAGEKVEEELLEKTPNKFNRFSVMEFCVIGLKIIL